MLMSVTGAWAVQLSGAGTSANPYLISNSTELLSFHNECANNPSACGKLTADIDMTGKTWNPEGNFTYIGTFDGDNHVISNLSSSVGLFQNTGAATIKNLGLENCIIRSMDVNVGALASTAVGTKFINCYVMGIITSSDASANCGGLVGMAGGNTQLTRCYCVGDRNIDETQPIDIKCEIRPTFVSTTTPNSYSDSNPPSNLVDAGGTNTRWCAETEHKNGDGVWNIVVTTGVATQLKTIRLWNADNEKYPKRRWKSIKVYGSASSNGDWTELKSDDNLNLASNNKGLAGEIEVNASQSYTYYKIDVLDNEGDDYMQMSDMLFVVSSQHLRQLPVCGASDGSCTANLCYHYGSASSALSASVEKADVASGRLAYLLNGSVDYGTGPYYQKIGTDLHPVLTGGNYVYRLLDGNSYTNTCPHHNKECVAFKALTCLANGNARYYKCPNPKCNKKFFENGVIITKDQETILSGKPVIVTNHSWSTYYGLDYEQSKSINGTTYYNVTTLYTKETQTMNGDYIVTYTNLSDETTITFHEFFEVTNGNWAVPQTMRYYVNGEERTALKHTLVMDNNVQQTHKEIVLDNVKRYDIIKIVYSFSTSANSTKATKLYIAPEQPTGWNGEHSFQQVEATYDCVEGGYDQHYECKICKNTFNSNSDVNSDNNIVPLSTYYRGPLPGGHNFALSDQKTDEGLLKYTCQTTNCKAHDPSHFVIPNCIGTTGVEVTTDGETYRAVESNVTIEDAQSYLTPVAFDAPSLTYSRTFYANVWNPWFVPFATTVEELAGNGITDVATIESIHNYDTDMDGVVDKTVLEVILKKGGTLKAGVPYMVKTGTSYTYPMTFTDMTLKASTNTKTVHTETASAAYDFMGTYSGLTADEVNAASIFSLNDEGAMVHRTGSILPQRWYMKEAGKENVYEELSPAKARAIAIRVIGEEDSITGIRTIYTEDKQSEELLPEGIFDLNGRKLSAPQSGQINIINGKKQLVK